MSDLIDRESLIDCFESPELDTQEMIREEIAKFKDLEIDYYDDCIELSNNIVTACKNIIETEKAVDTERHAHWENIGIAKFNCSNCYGDAAFNKDGFPTDYCPHCGCRMDLEDEEQK